MRTSISALIVVLVTGTHASAQSQPITSAQDAACRDESRAKIFDAANPSHLSLYELGEQIYTDCMKRPPGAARPSPSAEQPAVRPEPKSEPAPKARATAPSRKPSATGKAKGGRERQVPAKRRDEFKGIMQGD